MRKLKKAGISLAASVALCATLGAGAAFAQTAVPDDAANWTIPKTSMTNTIWKDADGNVVAANTEGATQYRVVDTWSMAWSTSGPDYLGISNAAYFGNGGNGNPNVNSVESAEHSNTVGVWATAANESPNAYNWNTFYNLYATSDDGVKAGLAQSNWTTITSNSGYDSEAGVDVRFKYRPDIVWTGNNISTDQAKTIIEEISSLSYGTSSDSLDNSEGKDSKYYAYGDENYSPTIVNPSNNGLIGAWYGLVGLAKAAENVIASTADNPGLDEGEALTWKTSLKLPRSNRYSETPTECAVNFEKVLKGSVYYVLSQVASGNIEKKTVAYVGSKWSTGTDDDGNATTGDTVTTYVYDFGEVNMGNGNSGRTGISSLAVNQLGQSGECGDPLSTGINSGSMNNGGDWDTSTDQMSSVYAYRTYSATADQILENCDIVYTAGSNGNNSTQTYEATATEWKEWLTAHATSDELAAKADDINIIYGEPIVTNGSNHTIEKTVYYVYTMDSIYPELFPSMELCCFWCNKIYHLANEGTNLADAMSWIYSYCANNLPAGTDLSNIPANYDLSDIEAKFQEGVNYFRSTTTSTTDANGNTTWTSTDATINRVMNSIGLDGSTENNGTAYRFVGFEPSDMWTGYDITGAEISGISNEPYSYTGSPIEPAITVTLNGVDLVEGTDYTVSYENNVEVGTATVIVSGKGDYSGTITATFEIAKADAADNTRELSGGTTGTRYDSMKNIVTDAFAGKTSTYAVLATGENFPDALAAATLAGALDAPVVLASENDITQAVDTLKALGVSDVYVVGGTSALSDASVKQIKTSAGVSVERLAGNTRQDTAIKIAIEAASKSDTKATTAIIATGKNYADALAISPYAYATNTPIYLTLDDGTLDDATQSDILRAGYTDFIFVGGESVVSDDVKAQLGVSDEQVNRLAGPTRYDTSKAITEFSASAKEANLSYASVAVATGENYPDALVGAAWCGQTGSVMVLANEESTQIFDLLKTNANSIADITYLGGTSAISDTTRAEIQNAVK